MNSEIKLKIILIDNQVNKILANGGDAELLATLSDLMPQVKPILDVCKGNDFDALCQEYIGFYHLIKILETMAQGIKDGTIKVP